MNIKKSNILLSTGGVTLEDLWNGALGFQSLEWDMDLEQRAAASRKTLEELLDNGHHIYGVTTGFGQQGTMRIPDKALEELQAGLIEYHGSGVGEPLTIIQSRGVFFARIVSLSRGYSGIKTDLVHHMIRIFNAGAVPVIPSLGSVGASGDLTPLSYLAGFLAGKREGWFHGKRLPSDVILQDLGMSPWSWGAKEALALMNGTAVMTAIAGLAWTRLNNLADWVDGITALVVDALQLPAEPYLPFVHKQKHHPGPQTSAQTILKISDRIDIPIGSHQAGEGKRSETSVLETRNIQPRYSLRCAPQIHGVFRDTLEFTGQILTRELNSSNDNPLFSPEENRVYHSGNFMGNHVSAAADYLRISAATSMNLVDRQIQLLLEGSHGLPSNLSGPSLGTPVFGLKSLGITSSALAAEAQHLAAPVSLLSRPTESGNQDVVSMGTISARHLDRLGSLFCHQIAHGLVVAAQAWELSREGRWTENSGQCGKIHSWVRSRVPLVTGNLPIGAELDTLAKELETASLQDIISN